MTISHNSTADLQANVVHVSRWRTEGDEHRFLEGSRWPVPGIECVGQQVWTIVNAVPSTPKWAEFFSTIAYEHPIEGFVFPCEGTDGYMYLITLNGEPQYDNYGAFDGYTGSMRARRLSAMNPTREMLRRTWVEFLERHPDFLERHPEYADALSDEQFDRYGL